MSLFGFQVSHGFMASFMGLLCAIIAMLFFMMKSSKHKDLDTKLKDILKNDNSFFEKEYKTAYGKMFKGYVDSFRNPESLSYKITEMLKLNTYDIERKLNLVKSDLSVEEFISIKILATGIGFTFMIFGLMGYSLNVSVFGFFIFFFGLVMFENTAITSKLQKRAKAFERSLPQFLDLLYSACKSGHTVTEAIKKVSSKYSGIVAEEFNKCIVETKGNGGNFRIAMENLAERNDIESLYDIVSDILIAFEKGDDQIIDTLKREAEIMRDIVNAEIEEQANRRSALLIFPMIIFSFFPLFAFLLLPMFAQMKDFL